MIDNVALQSPIAAKSGGIPLIRLENISKVFKGKGLETHALSGLHLDIYRGEYVAISGPSGCGKSTLLSILGLLDMPSTGSYVLDGEQVQDLTRNHCAALRGRKIGFIFQNFNLIGDLNVFQNVELPLTYQGVKPKDRRDRVRDALQKVGMEERSMHHPTQLSGGQQQRAAVARALVAKAEIILADEPTGNLDSKHGEAIMDLLSALNEEGTTICLVTHDSRYVDYALRKVEMLDGTIVKDASRPKSEVRL